MTTTPDANPVYVFFDKLLYALFYWVDLFHAGHWGWALLVFGIEIVFSVLCLMAGAILGALVRRILKRRQRLVVTPAPAATPEG